jgi:ketosteroid isomerase-like protein
VEETRADIAATIYDAFTRRDVEAMLPLMHTEMRFYPAGTSQLLGRTTAYEGHAGMRAYFEDAARVWEELRIVPQHYEAAGLYVLVLGRVYGRDSGGTVIDSEAGWVWKFEHLRIIEGHAFASQREAIEMFGKAHPARAE